MGVLKLILLALLLAPVAQAQTKPEQSPELSREEASLKSWERRAAQIKALKSEVAKNSNSPEAYYNLGKAYLREPVLGTKDAIKCFQQALVLNPNYAEAYLGLGDAYSRARMFDRERRDAGNAIEAYKKAISVKPDYAEAYLALGWAYSNENADKLAADAFKEAIRIKPDYAEAYSGLGSAYQGFGLSDEAIAAYKQAIKLRTNPKDRMTDLFGLELIYIQLTKSGARLDEYIDVVKQMLEINADSPYSYFTLGDLYVRTNHAEDAIGAYKKGITIKPQESAINPLFPKRNEFETGKQKLGEVYIKLGRYTEAIEPCKQAIQENPKNREAYRVLSDAYVKLGLTKEAVETSLQAVHVLNDDPHAYYDLGLTYVAIGDKESATTQYNTLIRMTESAAANKPKSADSAKPRGRVENPTEASMDMQKSRIKLYAAMLLEKIKQQ